MDPFTIRLPAPGDDAPCSTCGNPPTETRGPRIYRTDGGGPLCRSCGKAAAPTLAALLDLAQAAERVGQRNRHLLTPPIESLLDLARAAENYTHAVPPAAAG